MYCQEGCGRTRRPGKHAVADCSLFKEGRCEEENSRLRKVAKQSIIDEYDRILMDALKIKYVGKLKSPD